MLIAAVAAAAVAYGVAVVQPARYEARATLLWVSSQAGGDPAGAGVSEARHIAAPISVGTYADVAASEPLLARALGPLTDPSASDEEIARRFAADVTVDVVDEARSALIHLRVRADGPEAAAERAGALAEALLAWDVERARDEARAAREGVQRQIDELTSELNEVSFEQAQALGLAIDARREEVAQLRALQAAAASPLTIVRRPPPPEEPAGRSPFAAAIIAAALAGVAALGALLLVSAMRDEAGA